MFHHILVPSDFTEKSLNAAKIAIQMAHLEGAGVTLLHVIETIEGAEPNEFADFYEKLGKRAAKKMEQLLENLGADAQGVKTAVSFGKRVTEILRFVEEQSVDLIVLGSHQIDPAKAPEGLGTISYKVAILAACPVLMVK